MFFVEFIELFLPNVSKYLERDSIEFIDKEIFTDVTAGKKHEADLIAKCRFRGLQSFFLIHTETQSKRQPDFARRMFIYFSTNELQELGEALLDFKSKKDLEMWLNETSSNN
jgi:hypothetical protein